MSKLLSIACALLIAILPACSVPDDGSLDGFVKKIRDMDPTAGRAARLAEARQRAIDGLGERDANDIVGRVRCQGGSGSMTQAISVGQILECLNATTQLTFDLCLETRIAEIQSKFLGTTPMEGKTGCDYTEDAAFEYEPKWDPEQITDDDLARSALASPSAPPAWMFAAGIVAVGVGGVFVFASGWGVLLCPMGLDYGCPGDPLAPGDSPEPGGTTGGDQ